MIQSGAKKLIEQHFTFFSFSAAAPERMASSMASLNMAGLVVVLAAVALGLLWGSGGGGSTNMGACCCGGGGGGENTGGGESGDGDKRGSCPSEASRKFWSSAAASDLVWKNWGVTLKS